MNEFSVFIFAVLVSLFIVFLYCVSTVSKLIQTKEAESFSPALDIIFDRNGIVDCNLTKLPCVTSRQCLDNCSSHNLVGSIVCDEGFCTSRDLNVSGRPDNFECDSSLGLIKVFTASDFTVTNLCVSTYRDIIDDFGNKRPYVCDNGNLTIDLTNRQFSAADCVCDTGYTRMLFNQTALTRSVPVCIPDSNLNIYSKIYDQV
ncbi:pif3 [Cryptophlebia peltastica nucleopolyhedrovirus]|uniref:Pif3 n=1 Tax=Cryptophlebia peltastica nucleopolyhedrovirus TaxID=2304025 RepID=A0A346RNW4_9ABAC|nr:pif3 [Cryptophlebia peltastica nucleopolyhedrovirus]AXS67761.1 pif3 [Cryptophlebia peltastica nucleopolyhedrovirus]